MAIVSNQQTPNQVNPNDPVYDMFGGWLRGVDT